MNQTAGYSGRPLHANLGFEPGWTVRLHDPHPVYARLLEDAAGVRFCRDGAGPFDAGHRFCHAPEGVAAAAAAAIAGLRRGGMLWVSCAKKSSPLHAGVTEDGLRAAILPLGWLDVKVRAVDADWSGLKFLKRKAG